MRSSEQIKWFTARDKNKNKPSSMRAMSVRSKSLIGAEVSHSPSSSELWVEKLSHGHFMNININPGIAHYPQRCREYSFHSLLARGEKSFKSSLTACNEIKNFKWPGIPFTRAWKNCHAILLKQSNVITYKCSINTFQLNCKGTLHYICTINSL